jgi:hypothetical protein
VATGDTIYMNYTSRWNQKGIREVRCRGTASPTPMDMDKNERTFTEPYTILKKVV